MLASTSSSQRKWIFSSVLFNFERSGNSKKADLGERGTISSFKVARASRVACVRYAIKECRWHRILFRISLQWYVFETKINLSVFNYVNYKGKIYFYPSTGLNSVYLYLYIYITHLLYILQFFSLHISGISSIIGSLNLIVTIIVIKKFFIKLWFHFNKISLFPWSVFITAILLIISLPGYISRSNYYIIIWNFNTSFFDPMRDKDPILYQYLFFWPSRSLYFNFKLDLV